MWIVYWHLAPRNLCTGMSIAGTIYNKMSSSDGKQRDRTEEGTDAHKTSPSPSSPHRSAMWHGLGLFGESYLLFSVGTLRPFWEALYPACFDPYDGSACPNPALSYGSVTYSVILGVMIGMVAIGALSNTVGRRRGSIITAALMAGGATSLALCTIVLPDDPTVLFPVMSLCLFAFGVGVGGEYPLSASSASERAMVQMRDRARSENMDHGNKMRRLLSRAVGGGGANTGGVADDFPPTPKQGNLTSSGRGDGFENGKRESLLRVDARSANDDGNNNPQQGTMSPPWQTLQSWKHMAHDQSSGGILTSVVEESYGEREDGGGIPMSPTNVTGETADSLSSYNARLRTRGRDVLLVFSMQGMGILANSTMLTLLLAVTRRRRDDDVDDDNGAGAVRIDDEYYYTPATLLNIWRTAYATGAAVLIYVLVSRIMHLTESEVWAADREQRREELEGERAREEGVGFHPPEQRRGEKVGPYEKRMKMEEVAAKAKTTGGGGASAGGGGHQEPVISPTMSSITMRSEFDLLGSTNLDGCKLVPAVMMAESHDSDEASSNSKKKRGSRSRETLLLFRHYGVRLFGTSVTWLLWDIGERMSSCSKETEHLTMCFVYPPSHLSNRSAYYGNKLFQSSFLIALTGDDASIVDITRGTKLTHITCKAMMPTSCILFLLPTLNASSIFFSICYQCVRGTAWVLCRRRHRGRSRLRPTCPPTNRLHHNRHILLTLWPAERSSLVNVVGRHVLRQFFFRPVRTKLHNILNTERGISDEHAGSMPWHICIGREVGRADSIDIVPSLG